MIVCPLFNGDDDSLIAWKQHDVYPTALAIMVQSCNRLARFAKAVLDDETHPTWGNIESCDHRTLQGAHDILAATWRFRHDCRQAELDLDRGLLPPVPRTPENRWIGWLTQEVESWVYAPHLVRHVLLILANQNQPVGYDAEKRLCLALMDRFTDVPWTDAHKQAYEQEQ